ncbi:MAG: homoserine O-acetyltransferase [Acidobacteriota bacterium]
MTLHSVDTRTFESSQGLLLDSGERLASFRLAYRTWGQLDSRRSNAVLVCHALTGNADVDQWWPELLAEGRALDPRRDFVIASNVLGGCYGSTGPASPRPGCRRHYGPNFPHLTIRDMVRAQARLLEHLGVRRLSLVVGGSMGGMQVLEWAALYPQRVEAIAPICVSARHSPWCIAWSSAQRRAIETDPCWRGGWYCAEKGPEQGLAVARMMALVSYRSRQSFGRFEREERQPGYFQVESYLDYQGRKLVQRFDANSYMVLTRAMDRHDVGAGRGGVAAALGRLSQPALVVGVDSDVLYPVEEQRELHRRLPAGRLEILSSRHGHDGFLTEGRDLSERLAAFRRRLTKRSAA